MSCRVRIRACTERELQRGEGGDHTPEEMSNGADPHHLAMEAFEGGSPKFDTGEIRDDVDVVRREVLSMGQSVQALSSR